MKASPLAFACMTIVLWASVARSATIIIVNKDSAGVGFNDTTPATPVGGNSGATLGEQRLNVFQAAASIWGAKLSSTVTIKIAANFGPLAPCTTTSGVLGSAGPTDFVGNFTNAPRADTWYPIALASALAGIDYADAAHNNKPDGASISAQFNSNIGTADCLSSLSWYLGLDGNHGSQIDLETVLLHEFGHGLGFIGLVDLSNGSTPGGFPDIFSVYTYDNSVAMHWYTMSDTQRLTSSTNAGNVVFDGTNTTSGATILSVGKDGSGHPKLYTPSPVESGSSVWHFDTTASPNQLMEPVINSDLTHSVDLPSDLTMKTMLDLGWSQACAVAAPLDMTANATLTTSVSLNWNTDACAATYDIYRSASGSSYSKINSTASTTFTDTTASANTAYLYAVKAVDASSNASALSTPDLATTVIFTDSTLTAGTTVVKAAHFSELRTAVNAVHVLAGLGSISFTDPTLSSSVTVKAVHLTELRSNLDAARAALSLSTMSYIDPTITAGSTTVRAVHIIGLRSGVQ